MSTKFRRILGAANLLAALTTLSPFPLAASECITACEVQLGAQVKFRDISAPSDAMAKACGGSGAPEYKAYQACVKNADQAKNQCTDDCEFYRTDPCFGECEQNYNECKTGCANGYTTAAKTCLDTFIDACFSSCINACATAKPEDCNDLERAWKSARDEANKECWGKDADIARVDIERACVEPKNDMSAARAKIDQVKAKIDQLTGDFKFKQSSLTNAEQSYASLAAEYARYKTDVDSARAMVREKQIALSWAKYEANIRWGEALASSGGLVIGSGVSLGSFLGDLLFMDTFDKGDLFSLFWGLFGSWGLERFLGIPLDPVSDAIVGITGSEALSGTITAATNVTAKSEAALKEAISSLRGAKGFLNYFEQGAKAEQLAKLRREIPALTSEVADLERQITFQESLIPGMELIEASAKSRYEFCLENETEKRQKAYEGQKEGRCAELRSKEKAAEAVYDGCVKGN